jgi:hypothetical protein
VERLSQLVVLAWQEGHLTREVARLIIETRVMGMSVKEAAALSGWRIGVVRDAGDADISDVINGRRNPSQVG